MYHNIYVHLESPYFVPMEVTVLADADCAYINTENQSCIHGPHRYWDSKVHTYICIVHVIYCSTLTFTCIKYAAVLEYGKGRGPVGMSDCTIT